MSVRTTIRPVVPIALAAMLAASPAGADAGTAGYVFEPGHPSLQAWLLPDTPPAPDDNRPTPERVALGKMLFFDPRLSGTGQVTCASCHMPERGWSDGMPTAIRFGGRVMPLASPALINLGYGRIFMWDGRMASLEDQAYGGQGINADINAGATEPLAHIAVLNNVDGYRHLFEQAYPGEGITRGTIARAIASFERSITSRDSAFDRWVRGDADALTPQQVNGFRLFANRDKGNCATCHHPPNFTDDGFHNIGLASSASPDAHPGRYRQRPLPIMKGAFRTPTLRDIARTAPYFHDGSAATLRDVVEHYASGGAVRTNLSPSFRKAELGASEKQDLVAFLEALSSDHGVFRYPVLPE